MSISRIDLHSHRNESCVTGCNKELRKKVSENDLCSLTNSVVDSLSVRCVGEWAEQKIYLIVSIFRYICPRNEKQMGRNKLYRNM